VIEPVNLLLSVPPESLFSHCPDLLNRVHTPGNLAICIGIESVGGVE
jgi:hypothetical protein